MAINVNECRMSKAGYVITAKGRLSYAQYIYTAQENKQGKEMYSGAILIPPTANLSVLKNKMGEIGLPNLDGDKNRTKKIVMKRFLDPNDLPNGGKPAGEEFEGWTLLRSSNSNQPKVFYPNGDLIPDNQISKEMYSGRWASFLLNPYWSGNSENPGVFLSLQGVQLLDHDENIGANIPDAEGEFDAVEVDGVESKPASTSGDTSDNDVDDMFG